MLRPPTRGLSVRVLDAIGNEVAPPSKVLATRSSLASESTRVTFDKDGAMSLSVGARRLERVIRFEDNVDAGDLYTPSIRGVAAQARHVRTRLNHRGPLVGELQQEWTFGADGEKRGAARTSVDVAVRMVADSPLIELRVAGVNQSKNHRLRIGIATGIASPVVMADAAFGVVERKPIQVTDQDRAMETPPATAPLHRYVSLFGRADGVTVHADGLAEYEADDAGVVWITLVRAVGDLSRNDLPERPGHAGWPEDVPGAQSLGPFEARFAIQLHGASSPATAMEIAHESDRFLSPLRGFTLRSATTQVRSAGGIELSGAGLVMSAVKESEDGRSIVLRCVNLSDKEQRGVWTLWSDVAEAHLVRLDETPIERLDPVPGGDHTTIGFTAGSRAVVTVLVRLSSSPK